ADLYRPDDQTVYPLVLMIHGGAWSAGDKWQLQDHARELAQAGFVALSINYRLAPKHQLTAQVDDCRWALKWAAEQASTWQADPSRLSLWGYSAGGHLAALIATAPAPEAPPVRAVVAGGAPCEFSFLPPHSRALAHVLGGTRQAIPHAYEQAAPLNHVSPDDCPFYFFHGSSDLLVPPSSSQKMYAKLRELNVETQYYTVDGRGHLLTFLDPEARRQAIAFLRQHSSEAP
ncbi:MAG: alpha/beta hydrolase, partial [Planctomycetales bacterium]|nr:alpha/beta hydrolase [Planctomycetales bacterium]